MHLSFKCSTCAFGCDLLPDDPRLDLLGLAMSCPSEGCAGRLGLSPTPTGNLMSAASLFGAVRGFGTPEEQECSAKKLVGVLRGARIADVVLEQSGTDQNRSWIRTIVLDNGRTLHLGASRQGALIYKVTGGPDGQ